MVAVSLLGFVLNDLSDGCESVEQIWVALADEVFELAVKHDAFVIGMVANQGSVEGFAIA